MQVLLCLVRALTIVTHEEGCKLQCIERAKNLACLLCFASAFPKRI